MSISTLLATISQTEAGMALFSAGLGGVSVLASTLYGAGKTRVEKRRKARLQDQFDGLLDATGGQRVSAIRSTLLMTQTFDAFVDSLSKREKKKVSLIAAGGGAVLVLLGLIVLRGIQRRGACDPGTPFCDPAVLQPGTGWLELAVLLPLAAIALAFVVIANGAGAFYLWICGLVREELDVQLPGKAAEGSAEASALDELEEDRVSYKQAKVDVDRRLMASMIELMTSESLRSTLAPKRFVGEVPENPEESDAWSATADRIVAEFSALQEIRSQLPDILKTVHGAEGDGPEESYLVATDQALHRLYFDNSRRFARSQTLIVEDVLAPRRAFEKKRWWTRAALKIAGRAPSIERLETWRKQRVDLDLRTETTSRAAGSDAETRREPQAAVARRGSGLDGS